MKSFEISCHQYSSRGTSRAMCAFFRSSTRFKPRFKLSKLYGYAHILCTQRRSDANEWCGKSMLQVTGPSRFPYTPILSTRTHMLINTHMKLWARNDSWPASSFKCAKTVLCCCVREFRSTHPLHFNFFLRLRTSTILEHQPRTNSAPLTKFYNNTVASPMWKFYTRTPGLPQYSTAEHRC